MQQAPTPFVLFLAILIIPIGFGVMVQGWPRGAQTVVGWYRRQITRFGRWAWRNYWRQIVWFAVGFVSALALLDRLPR